MRLIYGPLGSSRTSCKTSSKNFSPPIQMAYNLCVIVNRLSGYPPFYDTNNVELFKKIMAGRYEFDRPWWDLISERGMLAH